MVDRKSYQDKLLKKDRRQGIAYRDLKKFLKKGRRQGIAYRDLKKFLKKGRRQGIAYRDLRVQHRFDVSESTLRGRNLTKSRSERPREPQWTEQDSELLKEAMPLFNSFNDEWQGIVEGSFELHCSNGGWHDFASATCRAKFEGRGSVRKRKNGMKKKKERHKGHSDS
ncbi:hypothetical protein E4U12_000297 [Claviceps purpurea]|nr:hypothetical protein E4U12_000297 [Claviceps purpurea]KAG6225275.1 hypothetical protein E4U26_003168 [Claviceps purpurea]